MIYDLWIIGSAFGLLLMSFKQFSFTKKLKLLSQVEPVERSIWPKISIIIPACNEQTTIGAALRSLLTHDYPNLEIIVVNDRSTDETGAIVQQLCADNPKVRVVTIQHLTHGWIGKVHAQFEALKHATGDWILFSDADVHLGKDTLKKAVTHCESNRVEFLTLVPHILAYGFGIQSCMAQFLSSGSMAVDIRKIQSKDYMEAIGCGAFNFVNRASFDKTRGLEWLKMEVIDDGGFAFMMKDSGANCDLLSGLGEVKIEWYPTVTAYIRGLEKNAFSIFQYNYFFLSLFTFFIYFWLIGIYLIPFVHWSTTSLVILAASFLCYQLSNVGMFKKCCDFPIYVSLCLPIAQVLSVFTVWRGAVLCFFRGGIYWRQTFYSLQNLKKNQRLKLINFLFLKKYD